MSNIKLVLSYNGHAYCGWQRQPSKSSVEETLGAAIESLEQRKVKLTVAGRTDSGVHAAGQVVNFFSATKIPPENFVPALNSILPLDIRILDSRAVVDDFDARRSAVYRIYHYAILNDINALAHERPFAWSVYRFLDINKLNKICLPLLGTNDFTSFTVARAELEHYIRTIAAASFFYRGRLLIFRIVGNAFLWKMVRSIIGTLVLLAANDEAEALEQVKQILASKDRSLVGPTAPAHGLCLQRVLYNETGRVLL